MQYAQECVDARMSVDCEMQYRAVNSTVFHFATCTLLSGQAIAFVAPHSVELGKAIEIHITPRHLVGAALTAFVEVVQVEKASLMDGYDVTAIIKTIKG